MDRFNANRIKTVTDARGLTALELNHPSGSVARISLFGGHLLSCQLKGREILFLSEKAVFDGETAIRGGVPVLYPWFGKKEGEPKSHGFARTSVWNVTETEDTIEGKTRAKITLGGLSLTAYLDEALEIVLGVHNETDQVSEFQAGLHTYFQCVDKDKVSVNGLQGTTYIDTTKPERPTIVDANETITFEQEVDSVYLDAPNALSIHGLGDYEVQIKTTFSDRVVWNPGPAKAAKLTDLSKDGFRHFVCVEAVNYQPVRLEPGGQWKASEMISVKC